MGFTLAEIKQRGWNALVKELGYARATKFMLLYEPGSGDYIEERRSILKETTIEKVREDILKNES